MYPHYSRSLIMRHRPTDWASEAFMVMQPFVAPGLGCYEAILGLRAINCSFIEEFVAAAWKTWGALVLERHCNVSRHVRSAAMACTQTQCNRQAMAGGWQSKKHKVRKVLRQRGVTSFFVQLTRELIRRKLHQGEIHISALWLPWRAQPRFSSKQSSAEQFWVI